MTGIKEEFKKRTAVFDSGEMWKWRNEFKTTVIIHQSWKKKKKKRQGVSKRVRKNEMNRKKKMRTENNYYAIKLKKWRQRDQKRNRMSAGDEQGYWKTEWGTIHSAGERTNQKEMIRRDEGLRG